jgi:hypothetical protein
MAQNFGFITVEPSGAVTFGGDAYLITLPPIPGAHDSGNWNENFHVYQKDVYVDGKTLSEVQNWVRNNPTANSVNNPATFSGAANDATPGSDTSFLRHWLSVVFRQDNKVHSFQAINRLTGEPVIVNVTDASHGLHFGAVIQIVRELPNGRIVISRFGIGNGWKQDPDMLGEDLLINDIWRDHRPHCFPANTPIQISPTSTKPISEIRVGDVVMAFDPVADGGRGALVPKRVKRLFRNTTTEWIKLTWLENGEAKELVATPGHHMLDKTGAFTRLDRLVKNGKAEVISVSGEVIEATATRITYSPETAHLFEQASSKLCFAANDSSSMVN